MLRISREQFDLDESPEDLEKSTEWIFQGYLFFGSDGWRTDETYDSEVRAVVEQEYLPKVPALIQTNGPEQLAWPEQHKENRGGGLAKE